MFVRAGDVVAAVDVADSVVAQQCAVAVESVSVQAATARQVAGIVAADLEVARGTRLRCPDLLDCHRRSHALVAAASQAGHQVCVLRMAIYPHQALDRARVSAVGRAARESQRCRAELDQALASAHRPEVDRASEHFQPAARDLRLATYRST
jgi:hypothetical protein